VSSASAPRIPFGWDGQAPPSHFDKAAAASLVGKYVVIGVTCIDESSKEEEIFQMHGVIEQASPSGITVSLRGTRGGHSWTMPPNLRALSTAKPGRYSLSETGEVIENPDLLAVWTIAKPPAPPA
jgi:hypothetical protein